MNKSKFMRPIRKVKIIVFTIEGKHYKTFKSIQNFLNHIGEKYRLANTTLRQIKNGELVYYKNYLIKKFDGKYYNYGINPMSCKYVRTKFINGHKNNFNKLISYNFKQQQHIIIIDKSLNILDTHKKSLSELAVIEKISTGTLKSSLSRTPNQFQLNTFKRGNNNRLEKYYIYLKDLPALLERMKKEVL